VLHFALFFPQIQPGQRLAATDTQLVYESYASRLSLAMTLNPILALHKGSQHPVFKTIHVGGNGSDGMQ